MHTSAREFPRQRPPAVHRRRRFAVTANTKPNGLLTRPARAHARPTRARRFASGGTITRSRARGIARAFQCIDPSPCLPVFAHHSPPRPFTPLPAPTLQPPTRPITRLAGARHDQHTRAFFPPTPPFRPSVVPSFRPIWHTSRPHPHSDRSHRRDLRPRLRRAAHCRRDAPAAAPAIRRRVT